MLNDTCKIENRYKRTSSATLYAFEINFASYQIECPVGNNIILSENRLLLGSESENISSVLHYNYGSRADSGCRV